MLSRLFRSRGIMTQPLHRTAKRFLTTLIKNAKQNDPMPRQASMPLSGGQCLPVDDKAASEDKRSPVEEEQLLGSLGLQTATKFEPIHPPRCQTDSQRIGYRGHGLLPQRQFGGLGSRTLKTGAFSTHRFLHTSAPQLSSKDPYQVLGLPRSASSTEIKARYRELAKKHHPDLNPAPGNAEKMSAISAAYQLLSDPKQKEFFDRTGMTADDAGVDPGAAANGQGFPGNIDPSMVFSDFASFFADAFGGSQAGGHVRRGADIVTEVSLDFLSAAKGCHKTVRIESQSSCQDCSGTGCAPGTSLVSCRHCGGTGTERVERGPIVFGTPCGVCGGSGQIVAKPCRTCRGSGRQPGWRAVDLDFPPGIRSGMELRVPGKGHSGTRGARGGDLYVRVHVTPHSVFRLAGDDLLINLPLTLKECLLGCSTTVPTIDGPLRLTVPAGTTPGEVKVLKGKVSSSFENYYRNEASRICWIQLTESRPESLHLYFDDYLNQGIKKLQERGYGDLKITWELKLPTKLTERQKELIEEFDAIQFNRSYDKSTVVSGGGIPEQPKSETSENANVPTDPKDASSRASENTPKPARTRTTSKTTSLENNNEANQSSSEGEQRSSREKTNNGQTHTEEPAASTSNTRFSSWFGNYRNAKDTSRNGVKKTAKA